MNPSVSGIKRNDFLVTFVLGLYQGAEIVTARATEMVKGTFSHSIQFQITQLPQRDVGGF